MNARRCFAPSMLLSLTLVSACGYISDPAVRLSRCLEGAVNDALPAATSIQASCDLRLAGSFVVILHPSGELTDSQLIEAGLPADVIPELRVMRIGDNASIYVISTGANVTGVGTARTVLSSRTTSQNNFVKIDHLIIQAKTSQPVIVDIAGTAGARVIQAVR